MEKKNIGDDVISPHRKLNRKLEGKLLLGKPSRSERMTVKFLISSASVCLME
jgi:hypothetical protein